MCFPAMIGIGQQAGKSYDFARIILMIKSRISILGCLFAINFAAGASTRPIDNVSANVHPLHQELVNAKDYKAFFDKVKNLPESGGLYYATLALSRCADVRDLLSQESDNNKKGLTRDTIAKRKTAVKKLALLCSRFSDSDLTIEKINNLLQSAEAVKDPLMSIVTEIVPVEDGTKQLSLSDYRRILTELFKQNSPEAILDFSDVEPIQGEGHFFDGKFYKSFPPHDGALYLSASLMGVCAIGDSCNSHDYRLEIACARKSICVSNRRDYVKAVFHILEELNNPRDAKEVVDLSKKISIAYENHDVDRFVPASGAKSSGNNPK
jgi:hypothetical protein